MNSHNQHNENTPDKPQAGASQLSEEQHSLLTAEALGQLEPDSADAAEAAFSHMKVCIRRNYSNPPAHGGAIVVRVLQDDTLRSVWEDEVAGMRERIKGMRTALVKGLGERGVEKDFSFIKKQRGMFSFSGLRDDQVDRLRAEKSIYIVKGGRINVAGITSRNVDYLCDAMAEMM